MPPSGNLSDIVFGIDHSSLKKALQVVWEEYRERSSLDRTLSEIDLFSKVLENFLRSTLGKDALSLLRITGYQIMIAQEITDNYKKMWILTGRGPAVVTYDAEDSEEIEYINYPFELVHFAEGILSNSDAQSAELMKLIVDSINSITKEIMSF